MHYFTNPGMGERSLPMPGEFIWVIPVRYWEIETEKPVKVLVISSRVEADSSIGVFGIPIGEDQTQWYRLAPFQWFTNYESARRVQFFLSEVSGIISLDDACLVIKKSGVLNGQED